MKYRIGSKNVENTIAFAEIISADKFRSKKFDVAYLERIVKALKALEIEEIKIGIDEDGVAVFFITDRVGIVLAGMEG